MESWNVWNYLTWSNFHPYTSGAICVQKHQLLKGTDCSPALCDLQPYIILLYINPLALKSTIIGKIRTIVTRKPAPVRDQKINWNDVHTILIIPASIYIYIRHTYRISNLLGVSVTKSKLYVDGHAHSVSHGIVVATSLSCHPPGWPTAWSKHATKGSWPWSRNIWNICWHIHWLHGPQRSKVFVCCFQCLFGWWAGVGWVDVSFLQTSMFNKRPLRWCPAVQHRRASPRGFSSSNRAQSHCRFTKQLTRTWQGESSFSQKTKVYQISQPWEIMMNLYIS